MYFNQDETDRILQYNDRLLEVISEFTVLTRKNDHRYVGECPHCKKPEGLELNLSKKIFKCFKCGEVSGNSAISYLMKAEKMDYPRALDYMNNKFTFIVKEVTAAKPRKQTIKIKETDSFCKRMLAESGLTKEDVKATIFKKDETSTVTYSEVFRPGSVDNKFNIITGDDIIIEYYDLEGNPVRYEEKDAKGKGTGRMKEFFRIRYQYEEEHKDKDGKPVKYRSPYGSGSYIYIPDKIRQLFRKGEKLDRLYIQEGEKKAEKACKHGILSIGVSGIQNIAHNKELPADLITIIQKMEVKEVVFIFDSDFNDLSRNIKVSDKVDKRPRNFFNAARNFKEYMRTLIIRNIYVEIYIGHVMKNTAGDKGIDDLLANTLSATPEKLQEDVDRLILTKELAGEFLKLYKITSWTDSKLEEIWSLNNPAKFAQAHKEELYGLPEFRIGNYVWRFNADGKLESAQPLTPDETYWEEELKIDRNGNTKKTYEFKYGRCFTFLMNRGFFRYRNIDGKSFQWIHIQHPFVRSVDHVDVRDYVTNFTKVSANEDVLEMLYRGGVQYLGPDKLSNLEYTLPPFEIPNRDCQRLYFNTNCWEVTREGMKQIDYAAVKYQIWQDQKHDFDPNLLTSPLINVHLDENNRFSYTLSKEGKRCQFLQFLINTSNFTWRKEKQIAEGKADVEIDSDERYENIVHLVSKLAAFGFMALSAKDRSVSRAVIAMDGKQSEVGQSNGRSGKSILGEAQKHIHPTLYIDGKKKEIEADPFIWDGMTEKHRIVFIDDVRTNFSLEFLFANITGDWNVNCKGSRRFIIPFNQSPKLYITTNHALNGTGSSFMDRQYIIAFSDFYNDEHKPTHDFGGLFFDDWDFEQWNLFWNLVANCLQIYLKYGAVQAPRERIETRQLRQSMGEMFLSWADEYFSDENRMNVRLLKKTMYDDYLKYSNLPPKLVSPTSFKNKLKSFCTWKGYRFNLHMYDPKTGDPLKYDKDGRAVEDDKSGGNEYIALWNRPVSEAPVGSETHNGEVVPFGQDKPF